MQKTKTNLTPKQEKYAQNVAKGMKKKDAAIQAGYSGKSSKESRTQFIYSPRRS